MRQPFSQCLFEAPISKIENTNFTLTIACFLVSSQFHSGGTFANRTDGRLMKTKMATIIGVIMTRICPVLDTGIYSTDAHQFRNTIEYLNTNKRNVYKQMIERTSRYYNS